MVVTAKTLNELETLLENEQLSKIKLVSLSAMDIKIFGRNLRQLAQDRLLAAVEEKNQAIIASTLQIFFNLQSLPAVVMLVVDTAVKRTVEKSKAILDFDSLSHVSSDLLMIDPIAKDSSLKKSEMKASAKKKKKATSTNTSKGQGN